MRNLRQAVKQKSAERHSSGTQHHIFGLGKLSLFEQDFSGTGKLSIVAAEKETR